MPYGIQTDFWRVVGRSVCGASHRRRGAANQDAIGWAGSEESALVVAVADGHGSASCFRSATGAALAVEAALSVLRDFAERYPDSEAAAAGAAGLPRILVSQWRDNVNRHLANSPIETSELHGRNGAEGTPWRAYGSTVLAAVATPSHAVYVQLGDGDILVVGDGGTVERPWPKDARLLGVETTSLCSTDAVEETRVAIKPHAGPSPALVMLATDGYANSFREDQGFLRAGEDLLEIVRENGIDGVEQNLESWLNEASELGSGDDITLAILCRTALGGGHGG
jgi:serine/threonine protein phosphatase PrpC